MTSRPFSPASLSEKPLRYVRKGEGRRRLAWSFLGLALGAIFGLFLISQTRSVMLSEAAMLFPPGNLITRFVDSGLSMKAEPDAMELVAQAKKLPTGNSITKTDAPLFPQEIELISLASRYPDRADVQADFLRTMTYFRLRLPSGTAKNLTTPGMSDPSVPALALPPSLLAATHRAIKNGERVEPNNGYFPLMSALIELTQQKNEAAFRAIHRAALCSVWDHHAAEQGKGELQALQRRQGMVAPYTRLLLESNQFYSNTYLFSQVAGMAKTHAADYERAGNPKAGFDLRMNLVSIGMNMANSGTDSSFSLTPKSFLTVALTKPEGKSRPNKNGTNAQNANEPFASRVLFYADYLKAKHLYQASQTVKDLLQHPILASKNSLMGQEWNGFSVHPDIAKLQGSGMLTLAGIGVALCFFGCASLFLHRRRFSDYRLPRVTPFFTGGVVLGILLTSSFLLLIAFSEVPGMITFLGGTLTVFLLFLPRLTRSNPNVTQLFRVAGRFMATGAGVFLLCVGIYVSVSLWVGTDYYTSNSVEYGMMDASTNVTVTILRIVPLPAIAVVTGFVLGFFAFLFLICSIYAAIKRQPMGSGGLLHFGAIAVPVLALTLVGYAGSVVYTAERINEFDRGKISIL